MKGYLSSRWQGLNSQWRAVVVAVFALLGLLLIFLLPLFFTHPLALRELVLGLMIGLASIWAAFQLVDDLTKTAKRATGPAHEGDAMPRLVLRGVDLQDAVLPEAELFRCDLAGARLKGADLRSANLKVANCACCEFRAADLRGARLEGADLRDADFREADLRRAELCDADLRGGDLRGAHLRGAILRGVELKGADLRNGDFREANLCGANLSTAVITPLQFEESVYDDGTRWPDDKPPPGSILVESRDKPSP
ncbi:MAG: pentapeptide repeat-containing protein [Solirubrobacterales bacterium]